MYEEKIVVNANGKYPLKGILTLPENKEEKYPAVVLVHGSGSSNMDEKVLKVTPFKDIAQGLAKYGIASLRYNKRTYSHPLLLLKEKRVSVKEEVIEDVLAATTMLKEDKRIDSSKIYIIGHSMGAMLAPRIDYEGGNYAGLILMAGTPNNLEDVLLNQIEAMMKVKKGLVKNILQKQYDKYQKKFSNLYELTYEEADKIKYGGGVTLYYFKEMGEHNSKKYLENIQKPVLIMQGSKDLQVSIEKDFNVYKKLLENNENVTFKLYEGLSHCFTKAKYDDISKATKEFSVKAKMEEEVIRDIVKWIKQSD